MTFLGDLGLTNQTTATNISKSLTNIQNDISSLVSTSNSAVQKVNNTISFNNVSGDFNLDGGGQYIDASMQVTTVSDSQVDNQIQNKVLDAIKETAVAKGGIPLPGETMTLNDSDAKKIIGTYINTKNIVNNSSSQDLQNVLSVNGVGGSVNINNYTQKVKADLYVSGYSKVLQKSGVVIEATTTVDQTATSDSNFIAGIIDSAGNAIGNILGSSTLIIIGGCCVAGLLFMNQIGGALKLTPEKVRLLKYLLIALLILVVVGGIVWMLKSDSSEQKKTFVSHERFVGDMTKIGGYAIF